MLGVRRAGISETAATFQELGLIEYGRKKLRIIDAAGVEAMSCECFRVIRDEYDRLQGLMIHAERNIIGEPKYK